MALNKYIVTETSASRGDVQVVTPAVEAKIISGVVPPEFREEFYHFAAKMSTPYGAKYMFVSSSDFPTGDPCLYDFDYSNFDGIGSGSLVDSFAQGDEVLPDGFQPFDYEFMDFVSESRGL